ncbi:MAG TPA: tetratricopeptide repeat protein [Caulobacteraceae bacterium]|nr:tetratricopeptide repeat protein [Caulobacteraceae bacterium]
MGAVAWERGIRAFKRRDYATAIKSFDTVLRVEPRFLPALTARGFAHLEAGDFSSGMTDHDAVLELAPDQPLAWGNACWARAAANLELDKALSQCDRAVELEASLSNLDYRGFVHYRRGELDDALRDYETALKKMRYGSGLFMRGVIRVRLGHDADGQADIVAAQKKERRVAERFAALGVKP